MIARGVFAALGLMVVGSAAAAAPARDLRLFSLDCVSTDAAARHFAIDVNLDLGSHYSDFHGLGPLGEVDRRRIVFRIPDAAAPGGFRQDEYRRESGALFWGAAAGPKAVPGAVCKAGPPRPGFGANAAYPAGRR